MSSITTDQGILHYEVFGRGRPVILLHGWLGSWGMWQDTMTYLGAYYRTYAIDFWGFGESGRKLDTYRVQDFTSMVDQFMEKLGIDHAPLVGHSMGGTVSLSAAIRYPQRVEKVVIIGSPIYGSALAPMLKMAGNRQIAWLLFRVFGAFRLGIKLISPSICRDPKFPAMMDHDLTRTTLDSFLVSIATLRQTDLRPELNKIRVPVLGMFGDRDNIVDPRQWQPLLQGVPTAQVERFAEAGHFIMLDEPGIFKEKLKLFLDQPSLPTP